MNNYELECFAILDDILKNCPRKLNGSTTKYADTDRKIYFDLVEAKKKQLFDNQKDISSDCYIFLNSIYDTIKSFLENRII